MKNLIKIIYIAIALSFTVAQAQTVSRDERDVKTLLSKGKLSVDEKSQVFDGLSHIIENKTLISTKDLLEMCLSYSKIESSDAPYDLIYNLKKGSPLEFEKALKTLSPEKRARIQQIIDMSADEEAHGNG